MFKFQKLLKAVTIENKKSQESEIFIPIIDFVDTKWRPDK